MSVSDKLLDSIELLINNSVEKAGYDKTIQAQVISCEDQTTGKYKCRYQDAIIYAYNTDSDTSYPKGAYVYILVPESDMSKEKTILGTTKKLGTNYVTQAIGDQAYNKNGKNCVSISNSLYLDTNNKNYKWKVYPGAATIDDNIKEYINSSSSLIIGATFKTSISTERQTRGHYGITYNLKFIDNGAGRTIIKPFTIDQDHMVDNPYKLLSPTRQYQIFNIEGLNFQSIDSIQIFNSDFPNASGLVSTGALISGDIEISALELYGASRMSDSELNGVALTILTPQGTIFQANAASTDYKTLTAQVRVKGKPMTSSGLSFYWGVENIGISTNSEYYNKNLGKGWKCLNNKNVIQSGTETTAPIVQWVPSNDASFVVRRQQIIAKQAKYKVAVIYEGTVVSKQIIIQNLASIAPDITIESSTGTQFYHDIGHPNLICKVNGREQSNYKYTWGYENNAGVFDVLPETAASNTDYANTVAELDALKASINSGTAFKNAETEKITELENKIENFNYTQRVQGNKIYNVQVNNITDFSIFKCSVENTNGVYLGTASITIRNSLKSDSGYSLVINNGSMSYQYNENGVSPTSESLDNPQIIQALTFSIYDGSGNKVSNDLIKSIRWDFPVKDTLLIDNGNGNSTEYDQEENYKYYRGNSSLLYKISDRFDLNKYRNQIRLTVILKDASLTAETSFTFVKQGMPGTNGTEYVVKLIPNTRMSVPPQYPMITKAGSQYLLNYQIGGTSSQQAIGITESSVYQMLRAQLWRGSELVWQGVNAPSIAADETTTPSKVVWEVLKNSYGSEEDESNFEITNSQNGRIRYLGQTLHSGSPEAKANIIKCSITLRNSVTNIEKTYYGTMPIITAWTNSDAVRVGLKQRTGFRTVLYTSDGVYPECDGSNTFEFTCLQNINNVWEDISTVQGNRKISYEYGRCGDYRNLMDVTQKVSCVNLLTEPKTNEEDSDLAANQMSIKPAARYDGFCVNMSVYCVFKQNNVIIGVIQVPIHFLLNKHGLSHINAWDGNSIQINDDGGYILSPQMGAGQKDSNNKFTGVLMGEVIQPGHHDSKIGLIGLAKGQQSFFLNSRNGSALFGKAGQGQIIIDPNSNKALLYNGAFWKNYDNDNGLPINYNGGNESGNGLLIDLTEGVIRSKNHSTWGSTADGFYLDENGLSIGDSFYAGTNSKIKISNGDVSGDIDGNLSGNFEGQLKPGTQVGHWTVDSNGRLISNGIGVLLNSSQSSILLGYNENDPNQTGHIHSGNHNTFNDNTHEGFYLGPEGLSIGKYFKVSAKENEKPQISGDIEIEELAGWTVDPISKQFLKSTHNGIELNSADDTILLGNDGKIYSSQHVSLEGNPVSGFYIGKDGISVGDKFKVTGTGVLTIGSGAVAPNGSPYHWTIDGSTNNSYIKYGTDYTTFDGAKSSNNDKVYIGTDGIVLGKKFSVNNAGQMESSSGTIGGWTITSNSLYGVTQFSTVGNTKTSKEIRLDLSQSQPRIYSTTITQEGSANPTRHAHSALISYDSTTHELIPGFYIGPDGISVGDFVLNANGQMSGQIGGWDISSTGITSKNNSGIYLDSFNSQIVLGSTSGKIYSSGHTTLNDADDGFYLSKDGLSIGSKFYVNNDGTMRIGAGAVANSEDKSNYHYWEINATSTNGSYISYGGDKSFIPAGSSGGSSNKVFLGTGGISLGNKFSVSNEGNLIAQKGTIAGWNINQHYLSKTATISNGSTTTTVTLIINDGVDGTGGNTYPKIYTGAHSSLATAANGFYLSYDGLSIGSKFKVTSDGKLTLGNGAVSQAANTKHWTINANATTGESYIGYNTSALAPESITANRVYIGTDGISLGAKFKLTNDGILKIGHGAVGQGSGAAYWTIAGDAATTRSYIAYGFGSNTPTWQPANDNQIDDTNKKIYIGTNGISLNNKFSVSDDGELRSKSGYIGGWKINDSSLVGKYTALTGEINEILLNLTNGKPRIYSATTLVGETRKPHATLTSPNSGFYISDDGLSIGSKFKVTSDGIITLGQNAVAQTSAGGEKYWTIDGTSSGSYIRYGTTAATYAAAKTADNSSQVYIGTDGIVLGKYFAVSNNGVLAASYGTIGGWTIGIETLSGTNSSGNIIRINANGEIYAIPVSGSSDRTWQIKANGEARFTNVYINNGDGVGITLNGKDGNAYIQPEKIKYKGSATLQDQIESLAFNKITTEKLEAKYITGIVGDGRDSSTNPYGAADWYINFNNGTMHIGELTVSKITGSIGNQDTGSYINFGSSTNPITRLRAAALRGKKELTKVFKKDDTAMTDPSQWYIDFTEGIIKIGSIDAGSITAGTIDADRISASSILSKLSNADNVTVNNTLYAGILVPSSITLNYENKGNLRWQSARTAWTEDYYVLASVR